MGGHYYVVEYVQRISPPEGSCVLAFPKREGNFCAMTELEILRERLKLYLKAERDILSGQTVEVEGMRLTRASLDVVRRQINNLRIELRKLDRDKPRSRIRVIVPR